MGHPFGHEAAGEVVEVAQKGAVRVGDRVVVMPQYPCGRCALCLRGEYIHCQSGLKTKELLGSEWGTDTYAQFVVKQDWLLVPIPDGMSYEHASMACCGFGPTFGGMELMAVDAFDTVLVTGLGPVGLGAVVNARHRGARRSSLAAAESMLPLSAPASGRRRSPASARCVAGAAWPSSVALGTSR
jgi:L-iditol 2-dehydrogenase